MKLLNSAQLLFLFNKEKPADKLDLNKWETYLPVALHRTFDRLVAKTASIITIEEMAAMDFTTCLPPLNGERDSDALALVTLLSHPRLSCLCRRGGVHLCGGQGK